MTKMVSFSFSSMAIFHSFLFVDEDEAVEVVEGFGTDSVAKELKSKFDFLYIDQVRQQDKKLIKYMNVGTIVDFMVENKKVKYGFKYDDVTFSLIGFTNTFIFQCHIIRKN